MTKKVLELCLSLFLVVCCVSLLIISLSLKSMLDSQRDLAELTQVQQTQLSTAILEGKQIISELGYVCAVFAMTEGDIVPPSEANKNIEKSITRIKSYSERLGNLVEYLNDYRIDQQVGY
ncbi:MAG: hypothetical protein JXB49_10935 [Bacteroidales bacterium]|nr:hypothetical protein [Bacteroidales bacterium]